MTSRYYNRDGKPIDVDKWTTLFSDRKYQVLKQTRVDDWLVSTVWLGLNHAWGGGPPIIFETLILSDNDGEVDGTRYSTEAEALKGHKRFVKQALNKKRPLDQLAKVAKKKEADGPKRRRGRKGR